MKKQLLIASLAITSVAVNAQITITSSDMPVAGNSYIIADVNDSIPYGTSGANQTWDFSSWVNTGLDTTSFQAPSNLNGASFFPTATIGIASNTTYSFFKNSSSAYEFLGYYSNTGGSDDLIILSPAEKTITFPSTYQTTFNGTASLSLTYAATQPGVDSIRYNFDRNYISVIDAWGTLTTPAYSNVNTLRQFITAVEQSSAYTLATGDSVWVLIPNSPEADTSYMYRWLSNEHSYAVAEVYANPGDTLYYATYLTSTLVGVNEHAKNSNTVSVFPSPASDKVSFKGIDSDAYLIIFDVNGKLVEKVSLRKNTTINVSNYNNGVYFYNVVPLNGSAVSKGKFVVEK